jgi:glycosyltransferase involved in cell wall biosynthesis
MKHLSVVIPAFNEEERIVPTLKKVVEYLERQSYSWEVVVVDDGSSDQTALFVSRVAEENERVRLESIRHAGKGWAVKHGMLAASGDYRLICDADLATPIEQVSVLFEHIDDYDIVIGSRQLEGSRRFDEPLIRHVSGRVFNWAVRLMTVRDFQDTQCGFKLFRGRAAKELFRLQRTRGWAFDVEILYLALKKGLRVLEVPVNWRYQTFSKVRMGVDSFQMVRDTLKIRWNDARGNYGTQTKDITSGVLKDPNNHPGN